MSKIKKSKAWKEYDKQEQLKDEETSLEIFRLSDEAAKYYRKYLATIKSLRKVAARKVQTKFTCDVDPDTRAALRDLRDYYTAKRTKTGNAKYPINYNQLLIYMIRSNEEFCKVITSRGGEIPEVFELDS